MSALAVSLDDEFFKAIDNAPLNLSLPKAQGDTGYLERGMEAIWLFMQLITCPRICKQLDADQQPEEARP